MQKQAFFQRLFRHKWLILLCLAALAVRLYGLASVPYGVHVDEAGTAYDAWCIAHYGTDRYSLSWPVYFINYGGGQSPLYTYLCVLCIKLFGFSMTTVRLPAVLSSMLALVFGLQIVRRTWKEEAPQLLFALFFLIMPYFNMAARLGLDCNLMLDFSTMFLFFFLKAIDAGRLRDFVIAGIAAGLVLYTYAISYLVLPLFLLFSFAALLFMKKCKWKQLLCFAAGLFPLALPLITMIVINQLGLGTLMIGPFTIPRISAYRSGEFGLPNLQSILGVVKSVFFFDDLNYNSNRAFWVLYPLSLPFAALGLGLSVKGAIQKWKKRVFSPEAAVLLWFFSMALVASTVQTGMNCNRINGIYFAVLFFVVAGVRAVFAWPGEKGTPVWKRAAGGATLAAYLCFGGLFGYTYFVAEAKTLPIYFAPSVAEPVSYIEGQPALVGKPKYSRNFLYSYYLLATLPSPAENGLAGLPENYHDVFDLGDYHFVLPKERDENGVYILLKGDERCDEYEADGFTRVRFTDWDVLYREQ